jgi:hypothetical protein
LVNASGLQRDKRHSAKKDPIFRNRYTFEIYGAAFPIGSIKSVLFVPYAARSSNPAIFT